MKTEQSSVIGYFRAIPLKQDFLPSHRGLTALSDAYDFTPDFQVSTN